MSAITQWYTRNCNTIEKLFKIILTGEIILAVAWVITFICFEALFETSATGMASARLVLILAAIGHAGVPVTVSHILDRVVEGRLKWVHIWWMSFALVIDIATLVDAARHLSYYAPPESVRISLIVLGVLFTLSSFLSVVLYIVAMVTQPTAPPTQCALSNNGEEPLLLPTYKGRKK